jgi:signal transduction histidine kinase
MSDRLNVLSHELRSPVAALAAIAAAFHDADEAGRRRMLELASAACANIERLLRDASPVSLRIERLDAAALVRDAADSAVLSGAHVRVKVEPGLLVDADPQRLRQALDNLLTNAQTYAGGAGVRVSVTWRGDTVTITVADHGPGIPDTERDRIFEPGVRLDTPTPGSGLGLAVTRALVVALNFTS